jgi:hypothetical protein
VLVSAGTELLSAVSEVRRQAARSELPPGQLRRWLIYYDSAIPVGLDLHPVNPSTEKQSKETILLPRLRDYRDEYLRFTRDLAVPATNNACVVQKPCYRASPVRMPPEGGVG